MQLLVMRNFSKMVRTILCHILLYMYNVVVVTIVVVIVVIIVIVIVVYCMLYSA